MLLIFIKKSTFDDAEFSALIISAFPDFGKSERKKIVADITEIIQRSVGFAQLVGVRMIANNSDIGA